MQDLEMQQMPTLGCRNYNWGRRAWRYRQRVRQEALQPGSPPRVRGQVISAYVDNALSKFDPRACEARCRVHVSTGAGGGLALPAFWCPFDSSHF